MKKILVLIATLALATNIYACTTTTVLTPEGKFVYCTTCCDSGNNCNVVCL